MASRRSDPAVRYCYPGGEGMNLLLNSFEDSNEEKLVATEGRGSRVKCRETSFEREGFVKIP